MKLIVGLGNPGREYAGTRHNVGFMTIAELAKLHRISVKGAFGPGIAGRGLIAGEPVMLLQPTTFMNRSGAAVAYAVQKLGLPLSELLVIYDDLDLPVGKIRLRALGSSGGHNGIKSIIAALNNQEFSRLRIGIGRPLAQCAIDYVLQPFAADERQLIHEAENHACAAVEAWVQTGIERAASQYNGV